MPQLPIAASPRPSRRSRFLSILAVSAALSAGTWTSSPAQAAVPNTTLVEGLLTSTGGGAAADGDYQLTFAIYPAASGGTATWTEGPLSVTVKGGVFSQTLGASKPLTPQTLAGLGSAWLGVQVASDPELPRKSLHSVAFALRAGALDCSGCLTAEQLDPGVLAPYAKTANLAKVAVSGQFADLQGGPDLAPYAKTASLAKVALSGQFADLAGSPDLGVYAKTASLADVAKTGNFADLKGIPVAAKLGASCGTGLVIKGLKADGSYECVAGVDPSALPPDGLNELSNNLLTNQFTDIHASTTTPVDIPDNNPVGVSDSILVPDLGQAQKLTISVDLSNSDISKVKVVAYDPANVQYVLYDGGATGTSLKGTWPVPDKTVSGDLTTWIGKNPKGKWSLTVIDTAFLKNGLDGKLNSWKITVDVLSSKKVGATGGFQFAVAQSHPVDCTPAQFGYTYANDKDKSLYICNGKVFYPLVLVPIGTQENPGVNCKDILTKQPTAKDGLYWINGGASTAFEAFCDMTTDGGGWTLVLNLQTSDGANRHYFDTDFWTANSKYGAITSPFNADFKSAAFATVAAKSLMMRAHNDNGIAKGFATYDLLPNAANQTLSWMFNNLTNTTITTARIKNSGSVGTGGGERNAGDAFIDNSHAVIINSRYSPLDADNYTRLGTNFGDKCGVINCNGHNYGGWGGRHFRGGWGAFWEGAALNGYCSTQGAFGTNGSAYAGNNAFDGCTPLSQAVDMAFFVR